MPGRPNNWTNPSGTNRSHGGDNNNWHDRRCYYPRYYTSFGFGYGFGYPFGYGGYPFGYGYGYPYYGTSASLYYNGYHPYGYRDSYRYAGNGGGSVVVEVQRRLARAGYYRGPIDGVIGGGTRSAIRAWERAHGMRGYGRIDNRLLSSMGIS